MGIQPKCNIVAYKTRQHALLLPVSLSRLLACWGFGVNDPRPEGQPLNGARLSCLIARETLFPSLSRA